MKVNPFISIYTSRIKHDGSEKDAFDVLCDLIKPIDYISYDKKLEIIDNTIDQCKSSQHFTADIYRNFVVNLISAYTNLECKLKDFDLLSRSKLLDIVLSTFEDEYRKCTALMQMCLQDMKGGVYDG